MIKSTIVGYPRLGVHRELKFAVESYLKKKIDSNMLKFTAKQLRKEYWTTQKEVGIDIIPSNDFSYYDNMLDMAFLLNIIPKRYKELKLSKLDTYFAMARGYQNDNLDVKALPMKKWFNTNYHYIVPEIDNYTYFCLNDTKPFDLYKEAKDEEIDTKPVIIGIFTFLKLSYLKTNRTFKECLDELTNVYTAILDKFERQDISYIEIDEPILVTDLTQEDIFLFRTAYDKIINRKYKFQILLQTYFGDVRDIYKYFSDMKFNAIGLDLVEGEKNIDLIKKYGFPKNKLLIAGIINGKNVWKNDYNNSIKIIEELSKHIDKDRIYISTSCSLLHVPYTVKEEKLNTRKPKLKKFTCFTQYIENFSFAEEKLSELTDLQELLQCNEYKISIKYLKNQEILKKKRNHQLCYDLEVRKKVKNLKKEDFIRKDPFEKRRKIQKEYLKLPILPTTTIGSFPQTDEIKKLRKNYEDGNISKHQYKTSIKEKIKDTIHFQEEAGLDVLVHGEYERNDMVEYFGKHLKGFLFTQNGWVQSYGTRTVKPPIIFGDVKRTESITTNWIKFAQKQTNKPVKGTLTGPITILNCSFPREDLELKQIAYQIGLAIRDEVLDLEQEGIKIIQIDEAALKEKLPLRKIDWHKKYLDWAIPAFKLTHSKIKSKTSIHTHMCYSEFEDIFKVLESMDSDVISIETAKSNFSLLNLLKKSNFKFEIGPGIYDVHSPKLPDIKEIETLIKVILSTLDINKLWINPDCNLKTSGITETNASLINMVNAVKNIRIELEAVKKSDTMGILFYSLK
ncbi:5-methyltetrahydropteroyltriglutamate--homocysteine S-methyltransferase [Clostridium sp. AWRP]|uniref:5-methyltetrahydropteroyltriglutamate-- homocysteine S-methyltransferase n=1 Tax=Clostridium sp. AWRP TaxID=2212991 RepID=UPI000FD887AE|nr:5-methyltetrahydropteroyltriglutamate--homocysteine S-methyltransferase [Clostridium sp. AWRP]AZV57199.1 5-methyltetrahydropteroyltriglutamate--homocysteine S-methyltransferase [Clostridium sp. AWRP]